MIGQGLLRCAAPADLGMHADPGIALASRCACAADPHQACRNQTDAARMFL